jgi:hypothetical protein
MKFRPILLMDVIVGSNFHMDRADCPVEQQTPISEWIRVPSGVVNMWGDGSFIPFEDDGLSSDRTVWIEDHREYGNWPEWETVQTCEGSTIHSFVRKA